MRRERLDRLELEISGQAIGDAPAGTWFKGGYDPVRREFGADWPSQALTMIGRRRLGNLRQCLEYVLAHGIAGDFIETGVWRGGACIYAKGILDAHGATDRRVWAADSFAGLPKPNEALYPDDAGDGNHRHAELAVTDEAVRANFDRFGLLDDRVRFLKGWFSETLPAAPVERIAVLRLDGDMYESTMDALVNLYPKLQPGGFCIIDDYCLKACRKAVADYRATQGVRDPIIEIDGTGAFWQRSPEDGDLAPVSAWAAAQQAAHDRIVGLATAGDARAAADAARQAAADYPENFDIACLAMSTAHCAGDDQAAEAFARQAAALRLMPLEPVALLLDLLWKRDDHSAVLALCEEVGRYLAGERMPIPSLQSLMFWYTARVLDLLGNRDQAATLARQALDRVDWTPWIAMPWADDIRTWLAETGQSD